jgi:hypothetical protein
MEVLLANYRSHSSTFEGATTVVRSRSEIAYGVDADDLRARAERYRQLADVLYDRRVVAEVQACARELETEAALIERQAAFARVAVAWRRIG